MLKLTNEEQAWLDAYREALNKKHPGTVQGMLIYGSKARGQAHAESDLDVLLVVRDKAAALKRELRWIGYLLAAKTDVLPSMRTPKRNGKAGGEADHLSVKRWNEMPCASYEPEHSFSGVASRSRIFASSGDFDPGRLLCRCNLPSLLWYFTRC